MRETSTDWNDCTRQYGLERPLLYIYVVPVMEYMTILGYFRYFVENAFLKILFFMNLLKHSCILENFSKSVLRKIKPSFSRMHGRLTWHLATGKEEIKKKNCLKLFTFQFLYIKSWMLSKLSGKRKKWNLKMLQKQGQRKMVMMKEFLVALYQGNWHVFRMEVNIS